MCNALNIASRAAAQRRGLSFEAVFRQATASKSRNRDTAWYPAIDQDWPALDIVFRQRRDRANFYSNGQQRLRLADLTSAIQKKRRQSGARKDYRQGRNRMPTPTENTHAC
jgi:hypothetical protein